ncbi:hypothetical protein KA107_01770 [Candidatus Pacearchaeota archaeon]|nr:hypothetical protein [Candidatus Pacearchaeota archaeon]
MKTKLLFLGLFSLLFFTNFVFATLDTPDLIYNPVTGYLDKVDYPGTECDISYYYTGSGLPSSVVNSVSTTSFLYRVSSPSQLEKETTLIDGKNFRTSYGYDSDSFLNSINAPGKNVLVEYDANKFVEKETINGYEYLYSYDSEFNVNSFTDLNSGVKEVYGWASDGVPASKSMGPYTVSFLPDSDKIIQEAQIVGGQNINQNTVFNVEGYLTQDRENSRYVYNAEGLVSHVSSRLSPKFDINVNSYWCDGSIRKVTYASGVSEEYFYDGLGRTVKVVSSLGSTSYTPLVTLFLGLRNSITGFASFVTGDEIVDFTSSEGSTIYLTSPGDMASAVSSSESEKLSSPLADSPCVDYDGNLSFNESLFNDTFVEYRYQIFTDSCKDKTTLSEAICKSPFLWGNKYATYLESDCQFGCNFGRCLTEQEANGTDEENNYCYDSDGGLNYFSAGSVSINNSVAADFCVNNVTLGEMTCDGVVSSETIYEGLTNYTCENGCDQSKCATITVPEDLPTSPDLPA